MWFCESQFYPALSVSEWPVWVYDFEVHVAPRCQLPVGTILQSKVASGYNSGSRLSAHPNGRFRPGAGRIVCSDLMASLIFRNVRFGS
jgi:hypothetical protein